MRCLFLCAVTFLFLATIMGCWNFSKKFATSDGENEELTPLVKKLCKCLIHLQRRSFSNSRTNCTSGVEKLNPFQCNPHATCTTECTIKNRPEPSSIESISSTKQSCKTDSNATIQETMIPKNQPDHSAHEIKPFIYEENLLDNTSDNLKIFDSNNYKMNCFNKESNLNNEACQMKCQNRMRQDSSEECSIESPVDYRPHCCDQAGAGNNTRIINDFNHSKSSDEAPYISSICSQISTSQTNNKESKLNMSDYRHISSTRQSTDFNCESPKRSNKVRGSCDFCRRLMCNQNRNAWCQRCGPTYCNSRGNDFFQNGYCWGKNPFFLVADYCAPCPSGYGFLGYLGNDKGKQQNRWETMSGDCKQNYKARSESCLTSACQKFECNPDFNKSSATNICDTGNDKCEVGKTSCPDPLQTLDPCQDTCIQKDHIAVPSANCNQYFCDNKSSCRDCCILKKESSGYDHSVNNCKDEKNDFQPCKFKLNESCDQLSITSPSPGQYFCSKLDTTSSCNSPNSSGGATICHSNSSDSSPDTCHEEKCCDGVSCEKASNECNRTCSQDCEKLSCKPLRICSDPICIPIKIIEYCEQSENCNESKTLPTRNQNNFCSHKAACDSNAHRSKSKEKCPREVNMLCIMCRCAPTARPDDSQGDTSGRCQSDCSNIAARCHTSKHAASDTCNVSSNTNSQYGEGPCCVATASDDQCKEDVSSQGCCCGTESKINKDCCEAPNAVDNNTCCKDICLPCNQLCNSLGSPESTLDASSRKCFGEFTPCNKPVECVLDICANGKELIPPKLVSKKPSSASKEGLCVSSSGIESSLNKRPQETGTGSPCFPNIFHDICYECTPSYTFPKVIYPRSRFFRRRSARKPCYW